MRLYGKAITLGQIERPIEDECYLYIKGREDGIHIQAFLGTKAPVVDKVLLIR